jgi:hypothetical protein
MAGIGATRIFRIAVLAAIRCRISTRSARKSAHRRLPPDSGLYPEIGRRAFADRRAAIEVAASLSLVENHRLIQ